MKEYGDKYFKAVIKQGYLVLLFVGGEIFIGKPEGFRFKNLKKAMEELQEQKDE